MDSKIILAQLRSLLERMPNFDQYKSTSKEHHVWLAQAHALINRWDSIEAITLKASSSNLSGEFFRSNALGSVLGVIHRAIADLELDIPA